MTKDMTVFISYSWDDEDHKEWVLQLANYLEEKGGCHVILDQYDLKPGKELPHFMESSLEEADKVLIILTEEYKEKADGRSGGIGFEYSMISQALYDLQDQNEKFIPVLRKGTKETSSPHYLQSRIYFDMTNDDSFQIDAFNLLRLIYDKPEITRPVRGDAPNFDDPEIDPVLHVADELGKRIQHNLDLDRLIDSVEGVQLARNAVRELFDSIEQKAKKYTEHTDFKFKVQRDTYSRKVIVSFYGYSSSLTWANSYRNSVRNSTLVIRLWKGTANLQNNYSGYFPGEGPIVISTDTYKVDFEDSENLVWLDQNGEKTSSLKIEQKLFLHILESIRNEKKGGFRS